jgi:hypothetical protein
MTRIVRPTALRHWVACLLGALLLLSPAPARAGDPYLEWYTLVTPHFRIHFHGGLEPLAQRAAAIAEVAHRTLVPLLGWEPEQITEIVLSDDSDAANGSASTLPYNAIRLFATAPDDMSPLADYDDWLSELLTHEYTHVLHIDNTGGLPAAVNAVFGKTFAPNQAQPHWIREGLAVLMESAHTTGGRLRSTQFDMYLRADVLEGRLARLDEFSNYARRWPGGNLWYLYGAKFISWITEVYGPSTFAAVATDYGRTVIPWGINRSIRRATGRTYEELYEGWKASLEKRYAAQAAAIRARGLREGRRLTERGRIAASPRFLDRCSGAPRLLYFRDDGETRSGYYELPLDASTPDDHAELVARSSGRVASLDADCGLVFASVAPSRRGYSFGDLFRLEPGARSTNGQERNRNRLTLGRRARDPDVSPDGRRLVYVTNHAGTSTLRIAELGPSHELYGERRLVPSARFEQAYTPRFSPDGRKVAYSAWTSGGFRDLRIADVASGTFIEPFRDRALDQHPSWSPDGKTLYFTSDRSGVANVYAYDLETRDLYQVTNVTTGAYMPEVSPDGKTLVYVGYTSIGFDLYALSLDRSRWLAAGTPLTARPAPDERAEGERWPVKRYTPLPSLRPRRFQVSYGPGSFGAAFKLRTDGFDAVGLHAFAAELAVELEVGEPSVNAGYAYYGLPFAFHLNAFRTASPRADYRYGESRIRVIEDLTGISNGLSYNLPGEFDFQNVALNYTLAKFDQNLPVGTRGDPYAPVPVEPHRGYLGLIHLGYFYSSAEATATSISAERGLTLSLAGDFANPAWGSETTLTAFTGVATAYLPMPWLSHHVLALALSGGAAVGSYPRRGLYAVGGFHDLPVLDAYTSGILQSSFVLRGYAPSQFVGRQFNLLNAEYRFPIVYADRGLSTLPVFLRGVSGNFFADYGGAYDELDPDDPLSQYHLGAGAELWLDLVLGYYAGANIRLGIAKGFDQQAPSEFTSYTAVSATF